MSERLYSLIKLLSDGRFHSGSELGQQLGVSRAAVWKMLSKFKPLGLKVHAVSGKGYRLASAFEPLDRTAILSQLDEASRPFLKELEIEFETQSTNKQLLQAASAQAPSGTVCLAEFQQQGRGRRGRQWFSPYGSNIYLSLLWRFHEGTAHLSGLSLAVAVAVMRVLVENGLNTAGIKWPNDIHIADEKLAGILIDVAGESNGPCHAVIGLGMNYSMTEEQAVGIEQPWTSLCRHLTDIGRNQVIGRLIHHLILVMEQYQSCGLACFLDEWRQWDITKNQQVVITAGDTAVTGIARGIDQQGLLLLEQEHVLQRYACGEVSLRKVRS